MQGERIERRGKEVRGRLLMVRGWVKGYESEWLRVGGEELRTKG